MSAADPLQGLQRLGQIVMKIDPEDQVHAPLSMMGEVDDQFAKHLSVGGDHLNIIHRGQFGDEQV